MDNQQSSKKSILNRLDSAVDTGSLLTLKKLVGEGFPDLVQRFLMETERQIAEIRLALEQHRWVDVYEMAHTLKGSSGTISAFHLSSHCQRIEGEVLVAQDATKILRIVDDVESEFQRVRYVLEEYVCYEA